MRFHPLAFQVGLFAVLTWRAALAVDVTACGQTIPPNAVGVLMADLDCATHAVGVRLRRGATLELNGHSIAGGDSTFATVAGVGSESSTNPVGKGRGRFTIVGPGAITGTNSPPFTSVGTQACVLLNSGHAVIRGGSGTVEVGGCVYGVRGRRMLTARGDFDPGASSTRGRVELDHVFVHDALEAGVSVARIVASNVTASDNIGLGMAAFRRMELSNVTANDNGNIGLFGGRRMSGTNVTVLRNSNGVDTCGFGDMALSNLVARENRVFGACADHLALTDSTLMDNVARDIACQFLPTLTNTTCGTSQATGGSGPPTWGVCAND
jgi:hypothetical protein